MAANTTGTRFQALARYARRLVSETSGGVFGDALDVLLDAAGAMAGAAYSAEAGGTQVAELSLPPDPPGSPGQLRPVLREAAHEAIALRSPVVITTASAIEARANALRCAGARALLVVPVLHERRDFGALALLFVAEPDYETVEFAQAVGDVLALSVERHAHLEDERAQRAELEETHRMASLGLLTASVSQELRVPMGALSLQLDEQRRLLEQIELMTGTDPAVCVAVAELNELTHELEAVTSRAHQTVEQLSSLSQRDSEPEALDLCQVVNDALALARPALERRAITLTQELVPNCVTRGRRDDLAQVILNLVFNGAEACTRNRRRQPEVRVSVRPEDDRVVVAVEDSGPGVPDEAVRLIFRPFYTTKRRGIGLGLGLKVCSDVVAAHGGHIEVKNRPSGGAVFRVVLQRGNPVLAQPIARPTARHTPQAKRDATRQVLVVDDDPVFSRVIRRVLKGHEVRCSDSASEAEIVLLDPSYLPDLVLCDVFLPGINGHELHRRIASKRPPVAERFVFVTGGALTAAEADYIKDSGCATLLKPLEIDQIRDMLDSLAPDSVPPHTVPTLRAGRSDRPRTASTKPPSS